MGIVKKMKKKRGGECDEYGQKLTLFQGINLKYLGKLEIGELFPL